MGSVVVWQKGSLTLVGAFIVRRNTLPDDAQDVEDEVWLTYGLKRGWSALCKDGRIKGRNVERAPLEAYGGVLFYLDNQRLLVAEMVARFHRSQPSIYRAVARGGPRAYAVGEMSIRATWP